MTHEAAHPYRRGQQGRYCGICRAYGRHDKRRKPSGRVEYLCGACAVKYRQGEEQR
jgi:hypothetical protein